MRLAQIVIRIRQRRGSVAVFTAFAMAALLGSAALAIDVGFIYRQSMRLQLAADAGALGAARLLSAQSTSTSAYQAAALSEVNDVAGGTVAGAIQTPVGASYAANWTTVTITLTSTPSGFFGRAVGFVPSTISASATAGATAPPPPTPCVLATSKTATDAIQVDNQGSIVATGCPIFSDSNAGTSIYLNSGTIEGTTIGAVGNVVQSNSGSNVMKTVNPATGQLVTSSGTSGATSESDPFSSLTVPAYTNSCTAANTNVNDTGNHNGTPYVLQPGQYCGNFTVGGNGSTDQFQPGTYVIVNGSLIFQNADVVAPDGSNSASGVTFVLTGSSPGSFQWTNNSNTTALSAPTSGPLAGILVWQTCNSSGSDPENTFNGGGTLQISGSIYTPCGELNLNNNAKLRAASNSSFGVVAQTIYATGSASLSTTASGSGSSTTTTTTYTLLQ